jgi:hypothetical protein
MGNNYNCMLDIDTTIINVDLIKVVNGQDVVKDPL